MNLQERRMLPDDKEKEETEDFFPGLKAEKEGMSWKKITFTYDPPLDVLYSHMHYFRHINICIVVGLPQHPYTGARERESPTCGLLHIFPHHISSPDS